MNVHFWWYEARGSGISSWFFGATPVMTGLILSSEATLTPRPNRQLDLHRYQGALSVSMLALHISVLEAQSFQPLGDPHPVRIGRRPSTRTCASRDRGDDRSQPRSVELSPHGRTARPPQRGPPPTSRPDRSSGLQRCRVVRVLLVEDDDGIALPLEAGLAHHGYEVTRVSRGADVHAALPADIVLLDLGLPDMDGLDVCRSLRQVDQKLPIIVISARGSEIDRVVGLELGADDYLAKPFGMRELIARIRAVMRRAEPASTAPVEGEGADATDDDSGAHDTRVRSVGALTIDLRTHRATLDSHELSLTTKEFGVLAMLSADPGAVVTRSDLIEQVWDEHWYGPTKTLDVHVAQLRKKLGNPAWVENVRSIGYRLVDPTETSA